MVRRVGLLGGESTGKSTLAGALGRELPACVVREGLRDFVDHHGRTPTRGEQATILAEQVTREDHVVSTCPHPWVVADPAPLMTAVYSLLYFDDPSLLSEGLRHAYGYDLIVWCAPDFPWRPDGRQRDGDDLRQRADELISTLVRDDLEPQGIPVLRATGDVAARVASVRRAWRPEAPEPAT